MNPIIAKWRNLTPLTKKVIKGIAVAGAGLGALGASQYIPSDNDPSVLHGNRFPKNDIDSRKALSLSLRRTRGNLEEGASLLRDSGAALLGRGSAAGADLLERAPEIGTEALGRGARALERGSGRLAGTLRDRLGN